MGALDTLLEIAEGTVEVLGVVSYRADRIDQIRAAGGAPAPSPEPSRYGRGRASAAARSAATTAHDGPSAAAAPSGSSSGSSSGSPEPSIESVIDAQTQRTVWIVKHGADRIECNSEEAAKKVQRAFR